MKIKTKLTFGLGLLFCLIIFLTVVSVLYIRSLKQDTNNILTSNYYSLEYTLNMLQALDSMKTHPEAIAHFGENLERQKANVTESGEEQATSVIEKQFRILKTTTNPDLTGSDIRADLIRLASLNMEVIKQKSQTANHTAVTAILWVTVAGLLCTLIAVLLLAWLPGYIIRPIRELDFARSNFIATISHELKTPISSIQMSTHLLKHVATGTLNDEQKQLIGGIKDDSERLLRITGELLNMSQVETGNIQLNIQPVDPGIILRYAVEAAKIPAEQRHITFRYEIEPDIPCVQADAEKTAWVLTNFLTNAIRYSPKQGTIVVSLRKHTRGIIFSVKDSGKGIEACYKEKIFMRYFQIPGSSKSGTGLGLAISKEFIDAQGGSIGVDSIQGAGSIFYFTLPAHTH